MEDLRNATDAISPGAKLANFWGIVQMSIT
jgi:hypothetical protein